MELPKLKVKPGMEAEFEKRVMAAHAIAKGTLGWSGQARLMADLKVDHYIFGRKIKGNARQRRKFYKKNIKQVYLQSIFECCEAIK